MNKNYFFSRRQFLSGVLTALSSMALAKLLALRSPEWKIPDLSGLKPGSSFDLAATLPKEKFGFLGKHKKGSFSVDQSGFALPKGVHLSTDGVLRVDADAAYVSVDGVIFSYSDSAA